MTAAVYESNGDSAAAQKRIYRLPLSEAAQIIDDLIKREQRKPSDAATQDALIHLSQAIGLRLPYTALRPAPNAPTPEKILVVVTPTPKLQSFRIVERTALTCTDEPEIAHLRIFVRDRAGRDVPNIGIEIQSGGNVETIYTGLKPERGLGYADYEAVPGNYAIALLNLNSEPVANLKIEPAPANCQTDRGKTPRGWKLVFQQQ